MRKWQDLAAPDDPGAWYAVSNMWPTKRGTYETADTSTSTELALAGTSRVIYAFVARTLSGIREFVVTSNAKVFEYSSGALTDVSGAAVIGAYPGPMMAQYGSVTILVNGNATATAYSTTGNFAALAGAPKGEIVCVQSNAVLIFNTDSSVDGWAASDVGDYTNWTTGEASSGRIIATPGPITAAVPFGNDVLVFKPDAIYRMTYVGGVVKWQVQLAWKGIGASLVSQSTVVSKYMAVETKQGVAFGSFDSVGTASSVYLFDGASPPKKLDTFTSVGGLGTLGYTYNPIENVLTLSSFIGSNYFYYNFDFDAWGKGGGDSLEAADGAPGGPANGVVYGDYYARGYVSNKPVYYRYGTTNSKIRRCAPSDPASTSTCYLQTSMAGTDEFKTQFDRLTPQLRRRTDLGTDSASLELTLYRERDDTAAQTTRTISESGTRKRFDLNGGACVDNFARFKVTWTALDVEVDDFRIKSKPAGTD